LIRPRHHSTILFRLRKPGRIGKKKTTWHGYVYITEGYIRLNEKIIKVRYPLPIIKDQIDQLQKAKVFSTIDLKNGFFQVSVAKDSRKYTSFVVPNGQYEFLRMHFGLCVAPAYCQRYINAVFAD